ncbi:MAG: WD40/YVTN/BNR-like repeat-containing protein [Myxococcales bacterium]
MRRKLLLALVLVLGPGCQDPAPRATSEPALTPAPLELHDHPPEGLEAAEEMLPPALTTPVFSPEPIVPANAGRELELDVVSQNGDFGIRGMAPDGTVFAVRFDSGSKLYASTDMGRTFQLRSDGADGIRKMAVLSDGTLLANTNDGANWLSRSTDGGRTWTRVLRLGDYRMLTPHSIAELNGAVFYGEYQTFGSGPSPIRIWSSFDRGATWKVHHTFTAYRHLHGLIADEREGLLWALAGDSTGELLRSRDGGNTWEVVLRKSDPVRGVAVAVDGVPLPGGGLLYGVDAINRPSAETGIVRIAPDGSATYVGQLPGPSYAIKQHSSGAFLLGVSREPSGNVYAPGDVSARLFGSSDGATFKELLAFERLTARSNAHVQVHWELPSGEVLIEVDNVKGFGDDGEGFLIARPRLR